MVLPFSITVVQNQDRMFWRSGCFIGTDHSVGAFRCFLFFFRFIIKIKNWHFFSSQLNIYYHFQKTHSKFTTDLLYQQHFFFPKTALNKISPDKAKAPRRTLTTHLQLYSKPYFSFSLSRICGKLSGAVIWA